MASVEGRKVALRSSDGDVFYVEKTVAMESNIFRYMIEDGCAHSEIPLPNVNSKILSKVIEYCKKHVESAAEEDLMGWDSDFVKVDHATLFGLIEAAHYLNIKGLMDLTCKTTADMIKGKTPEEIRKFFNIMNDITPEEEVQIRFENQWVFGENKSRSALFDGDDDLRNFYHTNKVNNIPHFEEDGYRRRPSYYYLSDFHNRMVNRRAFEEDDDGRPSYYYF